jgi:hypothetical protein
LVLEEGAEMNILEAVLNAQGGSTAARAGQSLGLSADQTSAALSALVPALAAGLQRNAATPGGLESLLGALAGGDHARYLDDPSALHGQESVSNGNAILGHILGSKDASRAVATRAAAETGLGADVLRKLLPLAAALVMGSLAKQQAAPGGAVQASSGGLLGMLAPFVDRNGDGSMLDDVLGQAGRLFGGR